MKSYDSKISEAETQAKIKELVRHFGFKRHEVMAMIINYMLEKIDDIVIDVANKKIVCDCLHIERNKK